MEEAAGYASAGGGALNLGTDTERIATAYPRAASAASALVAAAKRLGADPLNPLALTTAADNGSARVWPGIKLSAWARQNGGHYRTAQRWHLDGKLAAVVENTL